VGARLHQGLLILLLPYPLLIPSWLLVLNKAIHPERHHHYRQVELGEPESKIVPRANEH
jgi:hypothetical protein